jgi:hypothetical protein
MNANDVNLANDFAKLRDMKNELRRLEESVQRRAERAPITEADEHRMTDMQARADAAYVSAGRRAPPPLPLERPDEYRRRLADGVKGYSPRFREVDLSGVVDAGLAVIEQQIYADAVTHGRTHGLESRQIKPIETRTAAGHSAIEYVGGENGWFGRQFERPARRAVFQQPEQYAAMSRDSQLSRIGQIMHTHRPAMQAPRATF